MLRYSVGVAALAAGLVVAPTLRAQSPQPPIGPGIDGFIAWLDLAARHAPGVFDDSITQLRRTEVVRHFSLEEDLDALIEFIKDPALSVPKRRRRKFERDELIQLRNIAADARRHGTTDRLLRTIALLESDDLMLTGGERHVVVPPNSEIRKDMIFSQDGISLEAVATPPNWRIARLAISAMSQDPATVRWARLWYEATTAFLFADRVQAVLPTHLEERRTAFRDDAGAWFDEGCLFDELAGPRFQHAMMDGRRKGLYVKEHERDDALKQARKSFEEAVRLDPKHAEARVRLARVKLLQGDGKSSAAELKAVLPALGGDEVLRYFGHLFLGAALESVGEEAAAMGAYREAAKLYPRATSPVVAIARLEPPSASDADSLEVLLREDRRNADDPWLRYHMGPARRSQGLASVLWRLSRAQ
jgi:tetratricopeptide (TPR) repeat protein